MLTEGGLISMKKLTGRDVDRGELQRYLGYVCLCPAMLVQPAVLVWEAVGASTLRVCDSEDESRAAVDLEIGEDGCPAVFRAERPRPRQADGADRFVGRGGGVPGA